MLAVRGCVTTQSEQEFTKCKAWLEQCRDKLAADVELVSDQEGSDLMYKAYSEINSIYVDAASADRVKKISYFARALRVFDSNTPVSEKMSAIFDTQNSAGLTPAQAFSDELKIYLNYKLSNKKSFKR